MRSAALYKQHCPSKARFFFLCCAQLAVLCDSSYYTMSSPSQDNPERTQEISEPSLDEDEQLLDEISKDPERRELWMRKLGISSRTPAASSGKGNGSQESHPTLSGKRGVDWPPIHQPSPYWPPPMMFPAGYPFFPPQAGWPPHTLGAGGPSTSWAAQGACGGGMAQPGARLGGEEGCSDESPPGDPEEDCVDLLDEAEALELVKFDPSVEPKESWTPPKVIESFLEKHFNRSLADGEREAIMKDFPKPLSGSLAVPKLDNQVKEHLKRKGKDPHFGAEKSLFKVQENLLDVAGVV